METKRTRRTFTHEFKKQAAERVIVGKEKATAVAQELGINPVSLYQWIREYEPPTQTSNKDLASAPSAQPATNNQKTDETQAVKNQAAPVPPQPDQNQIGLTEKQPGNFDLQKSVSIDLTQSPAFSAKETQKDEAVAAIKRTTVEVPAPTADGQNHPTSTQSDIASIKTKPSTMNERPQETEEKPVVHTQPEGFQIKYCTIHSSKEEAIRAGQEAMASRAQQSAKAQQAPAPAVTQTPPPVEKAPEPVATPVPPPQKTFTLNLPDKNKRNGQAQEKQRQPLQQRPNDDARTQVLEREERLVPERRVVPERTPTETVSDFTQSSEPTPPPPQEQYQERNGREQGRDFRQKQKKNKQFGNDRYQRNENRERVELEEGQPERTIPERPPRPVPTAAEGRSWKVKGALAQRPNYRDENEKHGYVDEFNIPAKNLNEVWQILSIMQESVDKRAFSDMVHARQLNVPEEVLEDPKACTMQGPNIPNKPWLRKPRMHQAAEEFFQTTPEYAKSVYENYCGLDIRLDKNSDGTPILSVQESPTGERAITIDFSKFDRFVDDFYGDFVRECKEVMMKRNPREYSSLNSFIRIPDEPLWNPKLWAGVRTFTWRPGETLSEAWINYASNNQRKNQRYR